MVYILIIIFLLLLIGVIFSTKISENQIVFYSFCFILFCIAAFRGEGVDRDYDSYISFFENIDTSSFVEVSFIFIARIVSFFSQNVLYVFVIYAFLGVYIKMTGIKQLSEFWIISLFLYLCYSFPLHEMTQIRAGVAIGFVLLGVKQLSDRNTKKFILFSLLAFLFHYSSIFIFLLLFLDTRKINKLLWLSLIPISYTFHFINYSIYNFFNLIPLEYLQLKVSAYESELDTSPINVFNAWLIMKILFSIFIVWKIDIISNENKYAIILSKMYILSIVVIPLLADNPVFAVRISDIFAIADIILIPCIIYVIPNTTISKTLIIFYGFAYFFLNMFYIGIIS